jgi:hypothetical protein
MQRHSSLQIRQRERRLAVAAVGSAKQREQRWFWLIGSSCPFANAQPRGAKLEATSLICPRNGSDTAPALVAARETGHRIMTADIPTTRPGAAARICDDNNDRRPRTTKSRAGCRFVRSTFPFLPHCQRIRRSLHSRAP